MNHETDAFLTNIESRLGELENRAADVLERLARATPADEQKRAEERIQERVRRAREEIDRARAEDEVPGEQRKTVNVACAEVRVDVAGLELLARERGVAAEGV